MKQIEGCKMKNKRKVKAKVSRRKNVRIEASR